jgi:hypothetical protein
VGEVRDGHKIREYDASDLENDAAIAHLLSGREDRVVTVGEAYSVLPPKIQEFLSYDEMRHVAHVLRQQKKFEDKGRRGDRRNAGHGGNVAMLGRELT